MDLPLVLETYRQSVPELTPAEAVVAVSAAVDRARAKHPDFDRFLPGIEFLSRVVFCNHAKIPLDDYLETLYSAVKHGDFTRSWRGHLRSQKPAAAVAE